MRCSCRLIAVLAGAGLVASACSLFGGDDGGGGDGGDGGGSTASVPSVTTIGSQDVANTSAAVLYSIDALNGSALSQSGVCCSSTYASPTITNSPYTSDGTALGQRTSQLDSLTPRTTYYCRAYATNSSGTGYGAAVQLTTTDAVSEGVYYSNGIKTGEVVTKFTVLDDVMTYNWSTSEPASSTTVYNYVRQLRSNPSTGFTVEGLWFCYIGAQNAFYPRYFVVRQQDAATILVRASSEDYEHAYDYGSATTFTK